MVYLILNIILSALFLLGVRWAQERRYDVLTVGLISYIAAEVAAGILVLQQGSLSVERSSHFFRHRQRLGLFPCLHTHDRGPDLAGCVVNCSLVTAVHPYAYLFWHPALG